MEQEYLFEYIFIIVIPRCKSNLYENKSDTISLRTNDLYKTFNARQLNHIRFNELIGGLLGIEIQNRNLDYDFLLNNIESKNDVSITNLSSFLTFQSALFNKALFLSGSDLIGTVMKKIS